MTELKRFVEPDDINVVVHTCPERLPTLHVLEKSIAESDIGDRYWVACEPEGAWNYEKRLHYLSLLLQSARRGMYVLRLEDDILVNRHIIHNLSHWRALGDPKFGAGLVFVDDRLLRLPDARDIYQAKNGELYRMRTTTAWAQATLYHSLTLKEAVPLYFEALRAKKGYNGRNIHKCALAFDWALTWALGELNKRLYLHNPSLATGSEVDEVRVGGQKLLVPHQSSSFDPDWKRGESPEPKFEWSNKEKVKGR